MIAIAISNIRNILENKVTGKVSVKVSQYDVLYIQIINDNIPVWNFYIKDITYLLHQGTTTEYICNKCISNYKTFIFNIFLKNA
jgi:hypothetical protein